MTPAPTLPPARPHRYWENLPEVIEAPGRCPTCLGDGSAEVMTYGLDGGYELEPCPACHATGVGLDVDWDQA